MSGSCSYPETVYTALIRDWRRETFFFPPVFCHFLFSVFCDGITTGQLKVTGFYPSHANLLYADFNTKHISVNSLMLVLVSLPIAGNGIWAKKIKFLVFWGLK